MNENELLISLENFKAECKIIGKPLSILRIVPFSKEEKVFSLQISGTWIDRLDCANTIDSLFGILWRTTTVECRKSIFEVQLHQTQENTSSVLTTNTMIGFRALGVNH